MQATSRRFSLPNKKKHEYPLRGKVYCGFCGHALSRANNAVYICRQAQIAADSPCRDQHIRAGELESLVYEIVSKKVETLLGMNALEAGEKATAQFAVQSRLEEQVAQIQDGKQELFEQLMRGEIDNTVFQERNAGYDAELLGIKNTHAAVSAQAYKAQKEYEEKVKQQAVVRDVSGETDLSQPLVDAMIEKVVVWPDNRVEVAYKFADDFSA